MAQNILLVDDHLMFGETVKQFLESKQQYGLISLCGSVSEAQFEVSVHPYDIIIIDISIVDQNGIELCKQLHAKYPSMKKLILTMHNEPYFVKQALECGADGYVLKSGGINELTMALNAFEKNEKYFSSDITHLLSQLLITGKNYNLPTYSIIPSLTEREKEVLKLIVQELTTPEIADKLCIGVKTIEATRTHLIAKFGVRNVAGLVRRAIELRLV
jgi:DNA-binding NarL/FixJ family response regulator